MVLLALRSRSISVLRRHPVLRALLIVVVVLLALTLLWHLVGMEHGSPVGMLGGCVAVMTAILLIVVPHRTAAVRVPAFRSEATRSDTSPPDPLPRPPPGQPMLVVVLLH